MKMELTSPKQLRAMLDKYKFSARRERGQNFLVDRRVLKTIVQASRLEAGDWVLEVGAGAGVLTEELARHVRGVLTVELDPGLTRILAETIGDLRNVKIFKGDVMSQDFYLEVEKWKQKNKIDNFKIAANLPYQITSIFLRTFLPREDVNLLVLMVQKEVAERIIAPAGEKSLLSLSVQFYSRPEIIKTVSKNSFWPSPEIDSAVIRLDPSQGFKKSAGINHDVEKKMFQLMRLGFSARRKQLHNNLAGGLHKMSDEVKAALKGIGLKEEIRAQELNLEDWHRLYSALKNS